MNSKPITKRNFMTIDLTHEDRIYSLRALPAKKPPKAADRARR